MAIQFKSRILPASLALGLLALGIPKTGDSISWLMAGDTPDQLGAESPNTAVEAERDAALLERADDWFGDGKARIRAGILRLRLASPNAGNGTQAVDAPELARALDDLTNGLAQAPANAIGWAALAQARLVAGDAPQARAALSTSLLLDDNSPELSLWRCELGLAVWSLLDDDDRRLWNKQVTIAWDYHTRDLIELAWRNQSAYANAIRLALLSDPARFTRFERALAEKRANP